MENSPYSLTVKMSEITLDPVSLDNLASEFYGQIVVPTGPDEEVNCIVEFKDSSHPIFLTKILGLEMLNQFMRALDSFRIKPNTS